MDKPATIHKYKNFKGITEEGYSFEGREKLILQGQHRLNEVVSESTYYGSVETQTIQEDGLSAVDLRLTRPPSTVSTSGDNIKYFKNKNDYVNKTPLFENVNSNNLYLANISSDPQVENAFENANCPISNLESYKSDIDQVSHNHCILSQKKCTNKKTRLNGPDLLNLENNNDFVMLIDQETQTQVKESKETSTQTDKDTNKCTNSILKKQSLSYLNYSCLICHRLYTSKSSYDRHTRIHVKNGNIITNLQLTKRAKVMILGQNICKIQSRLGLPMTLLKPKLITFQCGICCKSFSSQVARDNHRDNFVLEEFPTTKCKECHVKFLTLGALHEHIKFVHERSSYKFNAYSCIFCNESFKCSFTFHLHLDGHLSTPINI